MATRCCSPPDRCSTRVSLLDSRPTCCRLASAACLASSIPLNSSGSITFCSACTLYQVERLEYETNLAGANRRALLLVFMHQVLTEQDDVARTRLIQPRHQTEQGGFTRAGRTFDDNCFLILDFAVIYYRGCRVSLPEYPRSYRPDLKRCKDYFQPWSCSCCLGVHSAVDAKHTEIKILILGDSLSAAHNIPIDQGWAQLFSTNIGASFPHTQA